MIALRVLDKPHTPLNTWAITWAISLCAHIQSGQYICVGQTRNVPFYPLLPLIPDLSCYNPSLRPPQRTPRLTSGQCSQHWRRGKTSLGSFVAVTEFVTTYLVIFGTFCAGIFADHVYLWWQPFCNSFISMLSSLQKGREESQLVTYSFQCDTLSLSSFIPYNSSLVFLARVCCCRKPTGHVVR